MYCSRTCIRPCYSFSHSPGHLLTYSLTHSLRHSLSSFLSFFFSLGFFSRTLTWWVSSLLDETFKPYVDQSEAVIIGFLGATKHFFKRVCRLVCPSVGWSVRPSAFPDMAYYQTPFLTNAATAAPTTSAAATATATSAATAAVTKKSNFQLFLTWKIIRPYPSPLPLPPPPPLPPPSPPLPLLPASP